MDNFFTLITPKQSRSQAAHHFNEIDFIKSVAIVAVITLHSLPAKTLYAILAPFHIWHAVPIFIVIAGMNGTLSNVQRSGGSIFPHAYSSSRLQRHFRNIIIPFLTIWLLEIVVQACTKKIAPGKIIYTFFAGGIGPGSYFTPVYIQHLMIFPMILWLKNKFQTLNRYAFVLFFLLLSLSLEWLCLVFSVPEWLYRLLYVRYLFAAFLGSYLLSPGFTKSMALLLTAVSLVYIVCLSYGAFNPAMMYPSWGFQHAPAYFYTVFLVVCLWHLYPLFQRFDFAIMFIGKATYHIFLLQMVWFKMIAHTVQGFVPDNVVYLAINIAVCLLLGCLFFKMQELGLKVKNDCD